MSSIQNQNGNLIGALKPQGVLKGAISKPLIVSDDETVYILRDSEGNEAVGVLVDVETVLDATPNDIRKGVTAVTEEGITVGEKVIPGYHTTEGYRLIPAGDDICVPLDSFDDGIQRYDFTKLQAVICPYINDNIFESVAVNKVAIDEAVYNVQSVEKIATVTRDVDNKQIYFGIKNTSESTVLIRYFSYKEVI